MLLDCDVFDVHQTMRRKVGRPLETTEAQAGDVARFQAYSTGSKPTQRRAAESSPCKSHRRSEVAASLAWLERLPPLPQVDVLITPFNERTNSPSPERVVREGRRRYVRSPRA